MKKLSVREFDQLKQEIAQIEADIDYILKFHVKDRQLLINLENRFNEILGLLKRHYETKPELKIVSN